MTLITILSRESLKRLGISKWKISKVLGVSWHTVHQWSRGTFKPRPDRLEKLKEILEDFEL